MNGTSPTVAVRSQARDPSHEEWNEDAGRIERLRDDVDWCALIAIADGVSTAPLAGQWARFLVQRADADWLTTPLDQCVAEARASFAPDDAELDDLVVRNGWITKGSAATLLVATVSVAADRTVSCDARVVGDCVLFVSSPEELWSFPITDSVSFTDLPHIVRTLDRPPIVESVRRTSSAPCVVAAMTDGLARWFLDLSERLGHGAAFEWLMSAETVELPAVGDDATIAVVTIPVLATSTVSPPQVPVDVPLRGPVRRLLDSVARLLGRRT